MREVFLGAVRITCPGCLLMGPPGLCAGSVVKGRLPQLGEKVLVKAAYNPGQAVPWNAVKVQTLSNQVFFLACPLQWEREEEVLWSDVWAQSFFLLRRWDRCLFMVSTWGSPKLAGYFPLALTEVSSASPSACGSSGPEARDPGSSAPVDLSASPNSPPFPSEA